jgi:hypothetical protein
LLAYLGFKRAFWNAERPGVQEKSSKNIKNKIMAPLLDTLWYDVEGK